MMDLRKRIIERDGKYCVESYTTGRSLGCYGTRAEAVARLAQVEAFKEDTMEITKVDEEQQNVFGWANVSIEDGTLVTDSQDDQIDLDVLEGAAYEFVLRYRESGEMHEGDGVGQLIESMVVTPEKMERMGFEGKDGFTQGWWVGFHFADPAVFAKVKDGEYAMFSIQGRAIREKVE